MDHWTFARRYVRPWAPLYTAGIVSLVLTNALSVRIPLEVANAVNSLGTPAATTVVPQEALRIAIMGAVVIGVRTLSRVAFFDPGRNIEAAVKHDLFARLLRQQPPFLARHAPGDLVSRSSADLNQIRMLYGFGFLQGVNTIAAVGLTGGQMLRISPWLTLWTAIPITVALVVTRASIKRVYLAMHRLQADLASISDHVLSTYQGIGTIHAFGAEAAFQAQFDAHNDRYLKTSRERANLRVVLGPALGLAASIDVFLLLWIGGPLTHAGAMSVGDLVAWITLVGLLVNPLRGVSFMLQIWKQAQVAMERLGEVMDPEPERPDVPGGLTPPQTPPAIEARGLSFAYPGRPPVLHDVSFRIGAGETLGVLGATGSGKTTLLRCIARLSNPPEGTLLVDGVDVRRIDLDGWRHRMAFVPQRAWLFSESLADNVLLGRKDEAALDRMLSTVTLDVDVASLPQGKASVVGESGIMLSGGQRQRVALARGLFRDDARVLMLDDVLSAVDASTERRLIQTLRQAAHRPTTVLVSHRTSALEHADRILVLDHGRVVDQGTHAELIARAGLYRDTWLRQQERPVDEIADAAAAEAS